MFPQGSTGKIWRIEFLYCKYDVVSSRSFNIIILNLDYRCLEEGAEEFFLKPVRPSDVSKLKPHMMKTKCKETEKSENEESVEAEIILEETEEIQSQQQQTAQSNNNNSKRKSMDEGLSPDRTRPRYNNGLTVMSN